MSGEDRREAWKHNVACVCRFYDAASGKLMLSGLVAIFTLSIGRPSIIKREVAPVSATACVFANGIVLAVAAPYALSICLFDVTTVLSSSSAVLC